MARGGHGTLENARKSRQDEFYTLMPDIEREIAHYPGAFAGKTVYCNCDDPVQTLDRSHFVRFFISRFGELGLGRLYATCMDEPNGRFLESDGTSETVGKLSGNGDFSSQECLELLDGSDVVVTNPPFSKFRNFVDMLVDHGKKFLVIGNVNALTYKNVFGLIRDGRAWTGVNMGRGISGFRVPEGYPLTGGETRTDSEGNRIVSTNNCMWITNIRHDMLDRKIPLVKTYRGHEADYPRYDNLDAINVDRTRDIPSDYDGVMGVPVTFLHRYNPKQFSIVGFRRGADGRDLSVGGRDRYFRVLIRRKA